MENEKNTRRLGSFNPRSSDTQRLSDVGIVYETQEFTRRVYYDVNRTLMAAVAVIGLFFVLSVISSVLLGYYATRNAKTVAGPPGPQGSCNLTQSDQTFFFQSPVSFNDAIILKNGGGRIEFEGGGDISRNATCIAYRSPSVPHCFDSEIKTSKMSPPVGSSTMTIGGSDVRFPDVGSVTMGGATFQWNGTHLVFPTSNVVYPVFLSQLTPPINIGSSGRIDVNGSCMTLVGNACTKIWGGPLRIEAPIIGPLSIDGRATFDDGVFFDGTTKYIDVITSQLKMASDTAILFQSPSMIFKGNVSMASGFFFNGWFDLKDGARVTCDASSVATFEYPSAGSCERAVLSSSKGLLLRSDGTQGIRVRGTSSISSNFTIESPMKMIFEGSSSGIGSDVRIDGNVFSFKNHDVGGDLTVNGTLSVLGPVSYANFTVDGSASFNGPVNFTSGPTTFETIDVNILRSFNLSTFYGLGAIFETGSNLVVKSKINFITSPLDVQCSQPIFIPNTPTTPTGSSCVLECTDTQRCEQTVKSLLVKDDFRVNGTVAQDNNVEFGSISTAGANAINHFHVQSKEIVMNATNNVKILSKLDVAEDILQNGAIHPCCSGDQKDPKTRYMVVTISSGGNVSLSGGSEIPKIPFNTFALGIPFVGFNANWNIITSTFTAPYTAMYAVTVYMSVFPGEYTLGTFRGVTLKRTWVTPPTPIPTSIRICTHATGNLTSTPASLQIVCTYNGFLYATDTLTVHPYYDYTGSITLLGGPSISSTRLEIYAM